MSYFWGAIKSEEPAKIAGAIFMGVFMSCFIGIPLLLANNYYELNIPIWVGIVFIIIIFPAKSLNEGLNADICRVSA